MRYNIGLIYLCLVFLPKVIFGQNQERVELKKYVLANMGIYYEDDKEGSLNILSTVGQPVGTKVADMGDYIFFEGFQDGSILNNFDIHSSRSVDKLAVSVYPNPVKDNINIKLKKLLQAGYYDVNVSSIVGELIVTKKIFISNKIISINLSHLIKGTYIFYIVDKSKNVVYSENIIKE